MYFFFKRGFGIVSLGCGDEAYCYLKSCCTGPRNGNNGKTRIGRFEESAGVLLGREQHAAPLG